MGNFANLGCDTLSVYFRGHPARARASERSGCCLVVSGQCRRPTVLRFKIAMPVQSSWTNQSRLTQVRAVQRLENSEPRLAICLPLWGACSFSSRALVFRRRTRKKAAGRAAGVTRGASEPSGRWRRGSSGTDGVGGRHGSGGGCGGRDHGCSDNGKRPYPWRGQSSVCCRHPKQLLDPYWGGA